MKLQAIISLFLEEINQQQQRISYITLQHGQMYFEMIRNMYTLFFFSVERRTSMAIYGIAIMESA